MPTPWSSFNSYLQITIAIEAFPWFTIGVVISKLDNVATLNDLFKSDLIAAVLIFSGLAGIVAYMNLVYNRLLILVYARALNGYRKLFAEEIGVDQFLWTNPAMPEFREQSGVIVTLTTTLSLINSLYWATGAWVLATRSGAPACLAIITSVTLFVLAVFSIAGWYRWQANKAAKQSSG